MRNLKRVLALGMALVLTLGLMVTASAATAGTEYTDDDAIAAVNDEAVQVLTELGIFQGDGKAFMPAEKISRAEVAALAYRITTADVKNDNIGLYKTWKKFDDVKTTDWYAGYVNYVANAGILDGDGQGNFYPDAKITGYQLLKIVLCALGYGQNGEYVGGDWDKRTASKAAELGLLAGVSEDLGQPITRATVAQILFNGMTKALVVDYFLGYYWPMNIYTGAAVTSYTDAIFGGSAGNADDSGKYVATLGYKQFALTAGNTTGTTLQKLGDREDAAPGGNYGEPVAKWYIDNNEVVDDAVTATPKNTINVYFNPVATFTTAVAEKTLYSAAKLNNKNNTALDYVYVDGAESTADKAISSTAMKSFADTGKGVVTEVFIVDKKEFVVIKNTYVDVVDGAYKAKDEEPDTALGLTGNIDYPEYTNDDHADYDKAAATLKDIKDKTVVIYNKYGTIYGDPDTIDYTTIHAAPEYKVTVTNTYDKSKMVAGADEENESYFLAGKKYEYNAKFATDADLTVNGILNRDADGFKKNQLIYTDDNGYVVLAKNQNAARNEQGYVVLTNAVYNNYQLDNVHYVKFTGYTDEGKAVTMNGGIDVFMYGNAGDAGYAVSGLGAGQATQFEKGIYHYELDAELNLYMLTLTDAIEDDMAANEQDDEYVIYNGMADALADDAVVDDETVYVIAKYNDITGGITGYTVKTGFKTIGDLYNNDEYNDDRDTAWTATNNVDFRVVYVNTDRDDETKKDTIPDAPATIDLVYIEGADAEDDNEGYEVKDKGFILLDVIPEDKVTEYDLHTVVVNGKVTTMKFWPDFWVDATEDAEGVYYEVDQYRKGYVYSLAGEVDVDYMSLEYYAPGVMEATATDGYVWADENVAELDDSGYLTLSSKCTIYEVNTAKGTCTAVSDITKVNTADNPNTQKDETMTAIVAGRDDYGFATVIYLVPGVVTAP